MKLCLKILFLLLRFNKISKISVQPLSGLKIYIDEKLLSYSTINGYNGAYVTEDFQTRLDLFRLNYYTSIGYNSYLKVQCSLLFCHFDIITLIALFKIIFIFAIFTIIIAFLCF